MEALDEQDARSIKGANLGERAKIVTIQEVQAMARRKVRPASDLGELWSPKRRTATVKPAHVLSVRLGDQLGPEWERYVKRHGVTNVSDFVRWLCAQAVLGDWEPPEEVRK